MQKKVSMQDFCMLTAQLSKQITWI